MNHRVKFLAKIYVLDREKLFNCILNGNQIKHKV